MDKHIAMGVFVGGIFAAIITSIAALDGFAAGGFVLLASVVFSLAAGPVYRRFDRGKFRHARSGRERKGRSRRAQPKRSARCGVVASFATAGRHGFISICRAGCQS
jgi:hypothetical protein